MHFLLSICFIFALCVINVNLVEIPEILKLCNRDDLDLDDCLKENIQSALLSLSDGLPKFNIRRLDPYVDKELIIEYKQNQISGRAVLKDTKVYGLGKAKVLAVRSDIQDESFDLEVDMSNKKIVVEGNMKGEGRFNALVFTSKGYYNNTMTDLVWTWKLTGRPEVKDGKTYMRIVKFFMRPEIGDMKVHIPDIFGDNAELNRLAYEFSNIYWRVIYKELLPIVEQTWDKIGTKFSNRIFLKIPYDELFPISQ